MGFAISLGMLLTFEIPAFEMGDHKKSIKISWTLQNDIEKKSPTKESPWIRVTSKKEG